MSIVDIENLKSVIRRIGDHGEDDLMFYNEDETIKYVLVVDKIETVSEDTDDTDDEPDTVYNVTLYHDTSNKTVKDIIRYEDMYEHTDSSDDDDDNLDIISEFEIFDDPEEDKSTYLEIQRIVNLSLKTKICHCTKYFIHDGGDMCFRCHLFASKEDMEPRECFICYEKSSTITMHQQGCCKQFIHKKCLKRCDDSKGCPMCRHGQVRENAPSPQSREITVENENSTPPLELLPPVEEEQLESIPEEPTTVE